MEQPNKCQKCGRSPMVIPPSNTVMCTSCRVSAVNIASWNKFMEPVPLVDLVRKLERPIYVLKAVGVLSDDKGLKALVATTLNSLEDLDLSEHFSDRAEAAKVQKELEALVKK